MANPPAVTEADEETTGAIFPEPVENSVPPLGTPPYPGRTHHNSYSCISLNPHGIITASDPVAMMALGRNKPKSDCFNHLTLDNHVDICILCNAGLLTNIRPSEFRVNGIGNSNIQFDQGDHPRIKKLELKDTTWPPFFYRSSQWTALTRGTSYPMPGHHRAYPKR